MKKEAYQQELERLHLKKQSIEEQIDNLREDYINAHRRFQNGQRVMMTIPQQERMVGSLRTGYNKKIIPEQIKFYYIAGYTLGGQLDVVPILAQAKPDNSMGKSHYISSETDAQLQSAPLENESA